MNYYEIYFPSTVQCQIYFYTTFMYLKTFKFMYVCMSVCTVHMYLCQYVLYVCMYVCMYVCTYVCMNVIQNISRPLVYVCMYVCMYVCQGRTGQMRYGGGEEATQGHSGCVFGLLEEKRVQITVVVQSRLVFFSIHTYTVM